MKDKQNFNRIGGRVFQVETYLGKGTGGSMWHKIRS